MSDLDQLMDRYRQQARSFGPLRYGRSVADGHVRGWGLQFGELATAIRTDPLYSEAECLAASRSVVSEERRMNLYLILRYFLPSLALGHIVEFGSYKGGNALFMAQVLRRLNSPARVYSLDTFAGMPVTDKSVDAHSAGDFSDVDLDELEHYRVKCGLDNLEFVKGRFEDTTVALLQRIGPVALAHVDCDIYSAVAYSYETTKPSMVQGGYWVFDDATVSSCIGATEAVENLLIRRDGLNSEQIFPHYVFRARAVAEA